MTRASENRPQPSRTPHTERLIIEGKHPLHGKLPVGGSKNTALMLMAAALLGDGSSEIRNVSVLHDVWTFADLLRSLGCEVEYEPDDDPTTPETFTVVADEVNGTEPPAQLVEAIRASFYLLGALVGRMGQARVALPGGDAFGERPVNLHLEGLRAFGAEVRTEGGVAIAQAPSGGLPGGSFRLEPSSVGATVNLLLAAATARGSSKIENAAREPDVICFGEMLQEMGVQIEGLGTKTLEIEGADGLLNPVSFRNAPDRIEAGTYVIAAAMMGSGDDPPLITNARAGDLGEAFLEACRRAGIVLEEKGERIQVRVPGQLQSTSITAEPYPGFPTDLQAQWTVLMTQAEGGEPALVEDAVYPDRFQHVAYLKKMGGRLEVEERAAKVWSGSLQGASVEAEDIRAGVALVLAALVAEGETRIGGVHHLDRGYEQLEEKLRRAGAAVKRQSVEGEAA